MINKTTFFFVWRICWAKYLIWAGKIYRSTRLDWRNNYWLLYIENSGWEKQYSGGKIIRIHPNLSKWWGRSDAIIKYASFHKNITSRQWNNGSICEEIGSTLITSPTPTYHSTPTNSPLPSTKTYFPRYNIQNLLRILLPIKKL